MIILSELTGKEYKTAEECLKDEEDFLKKEEEKEKAKKEHEKALDKAYHEAVEACDKYFKLAGIEVECDGDSYTATISSSSSDEAFDLLYKLMFE